MELNIGDIIGFLCILVIALVAGYGAILLRMGQTKRQRIIGAIIIVVDLLLMLYGLRAWFIYIANL